MSFTTKYNTVVGPTLGNIRIGRAFTVSKRDSITSGSTLTMHIENPSDSNFDVEIKLIEITAGAGGDIDVYKNTTVEGGTAITPQNLNAGSTNTSSVTTMFGVSLTSGTKIIETYLPGGSGNKSIGSNSDVGDMILLPPGSSLTVIFTPDSDTKASIRITWIEHPVLSPL